MPKHGTSLAFSLTSCCGVMAAEGMGENSIMTVLHRLKDAGKIENGYVRQRDLNDAMKNIGEQI